MGCFDLLCGQQRNGTPADGGSISQCMQVVLTWHCWGSAQLVCKQCIAWNVHHRDMYAASQLPTWSQELPAWSGSTVAQQEWLTCWHTQQFIGHLVQECIEREWLTIPRSALGMTIRVPRKMNSSVSLTVSSSRPLLKSFNSETSTSGMLESTFICFLLVSVDKLCELLECFCHCLQHRVCGNELDIPFSWFFFNMWHFWTRMSRQKVRWVVLTFCVDNREMVLLQTEVPSLNACRWSWLGIAEDQLNWFANSA